MKASQEMLQQQVTKYSDQMQRLGDIFILFLVFLGNFLFDLCNFGQLLVTLCNIL